MQAKWPHSLISRILLLVFVATLVPASLLIGGSWYLNTRVQQQMKREVDDTLNLAINLEQSLIDGSLNRMRDRAITLANHPDVIGALSRGTDLRPILDRFAEALPGADLITVVDPTATVRARAGSSTAGQVVRYGGLVEQVLSAQTPSASAVLISQPELVGESARVLAQIKVPILETPASSDPRGGELLEEALALVGAAPVISPSGQVIGVVLVSDILNNDHAIVDEVRERSTEGLPIHASIALEGIRVTTTVPAVGGGKRAVGTLYSDLVMDHLTVGQEYRGRALVGGWQWQRTIYLPLRDPSGQVIAGPFVGIPEAAFAELARSTSLTTGLSIAAALLSLIGALTVAYRLATAGITKPLERFTDLLTEGNLRHRLEEEGPTEMARMAHALNNMTDRIRQTMLEMARVSQGIHTVSDELADGLQQTAENVEAALEVAASALSASEMAAHSAQRVGSRMIELEVALARINAGSDEQTRTLKHASEIVTLVAEAVQDSRSGIDAVLESIRAAIASAQQGRHTSLRSISALDLVRIEVQGVTEVGPSESGEPPEITARLDRLLSDIEESQRAVSECDLSLSQIARATEEATSRLWSLSAIMNESGARAGAVSQQISDLSLIAEATAAQLRSTSSASRQAIGDVERMAGGIEAGTGQVRRAEAHISTIAAATQRLQTLTERIRTLAAELDQAANRFPQP